MRAEYFSDRGALFSGLSQELKEMAFTTTSASRTVSWREPTGVTTSRTSRFFIPALWAYRATASLPRRWVSFGGTAASRGRGKVACEARLIFGRAVAGTALARLPCRGLRRQ